MTSFANVFFQQSLINTPGHTLAQGLLTYSLPYSIYFAHILTGSLIILLIYLLINNHMFTHSLFC